MAGSPVAAALRPQQVLLVPCKFGKPTSHARRDPASKQASKPKSKLILGQADSAVHKNCEPLPP